MNVYISVPMTGRTVKEVEADIKQAKKDFPFNKKSTKYVSNLIEFKAEIDPATALGNAIESILSCDALYACPGWKESKGCRVEIATAIIYDIPVYGLPSSEMEVVIKKKQITRKQVTKEDYKESTPIVRDVKRKTEPKKAVKKSKKTE
ncbi:MAG: DUF4406 domain-containing protein [Erysipelotrichaceae bacterium]|nr:DUF4406 domain-containing protein [Erysipelotrichaceae bacterium]